MQMRLRAGSAPASRMERLRRPLGVGAVALGIVVIALVARKELALCPQLEHLAAPNFGAYAIASLSPAEFQCNTETCREIAAGSDGLASRLNTGHFSSGEIDLTGDGVPESVRLTADRVTIDQDGAEAWHSPSDWTVVDVALGDPNQDGRYELLVAFWRDDAAGVPRSQPFIVGYRQGQYRILWGGSPVTEPILEVALGDVDGDGAEDLVVLEATGGRRRGCRRSVHLGRLALARLGVQQHVAQPGRRLSRPGPRARSRWRAG